MLQRSVRLRTLRERYGRSGRPTVAPWRILPTALSRGWTWTQLAVRVLADVPYQGGLAGAWGEGTIIWAGSPAGITGIPASGGQSRVYVPRGDGFNPHSPSFLPDGRRFLYTRLAQKPEASRVCVGSLDSSETTCVVNAHSPARYAAPGYLLLVRERRARGAPVRPGSPAAIGRAFERDA